MQNARNFNYNCWWAIMLSWRYRDETLDHLRYSRFPRKVSTDKTAVMPSSLLPTRSCLLVDTCRWFPGSVPRWPWWAASSLWHVVKLLRYWGMSGSGKWSHMDQTIIIRSSDVCVSMCLRLIRYSFEKCVQSLPEWFGWTVGHISQFWWQGIKEHMGPRTAKLPYRIVWTVDEACWLTRGTRQYIPRRICQREFIPQFNGKSKFGACCSSMLHTNMMMYRSRLLSREFFFCQIWLVSCSLSDQAIRISVTILLKQLWSWFLLNGDVTFRMAIVATHTARMVSIEDD